MKKSVRLLITALSAFALCVSADTFAAVARPSLDIAVLSGDTGITKTGGLLTMDGTAFSIVTSGTPIDIPDVPFTLTAGFSNNSGPVYFFGNGTLNAGSLLTATFGSLTLQSLGNSLGTFAADLVYTGGSLTGPLTSGRIEGAFSGATSDIFSINFNAPLFHANVGAVVPLPTPILSLGSALACMVVLSRRRHDHMSDKVMM